MRLKSSIFVSALLRREQAAGAFAAVLRKGAEEAGAIFIVHLKAGSSNVYAPAPQLYFDERNPVDRLFERVIESGDEAAVAAYLDRQARFDPDCWIVEIEKQGSLDSFGLAQG